jgi:hypothetical protein
MMSMPVPGVKGTTKWIGCEGYGWATAEAASTTAASSSKVRIYPSRGLLLPRRVDPSSEKTKNRQVLGPFGPHVPDWETNSKTRASKPQDLRQLSAGG